MKDKFGNEIDLEYCEERNIQSTWFKFDDFLTDFIAELIESESTGADSEDNLCGYKNNLLQTIGLLTVGIVLYKHDGFCPVGLEQTLLKAVVTKVPYKHAKKAIDESRIKLAERIANGSKGGRPAHNENMHED